ncbi:MAG TPA: ABC transporter ATP-binding protein, partial [Bryobacteraceae bacterium]|nr:ABC transporter ATP-binding protein [Bryobacteraceae bacterium]
MTGLYSLTNVGLTYGASPALQNINLKFGAGEFVAVAGPNGAGKSTLVNVMSGLRAHYTGGCFFRDRELHNWTRKELARCVSVVPQSVRVEFSFTAEQVVLMGRTPHADAMFESKADEEHVRRAMDLTGTAPFRYRDFRTLSGGERQRVIVAAALAQDPEALLLDEPATWLDIEHQISLYRLLRSLAVTGVLVVTVTHDLNLAAAYSDRVVLLETGNLVADGSPAEVFSPS